MNNNRNTNDVLRAAVLLTAIPPVFALFSISHFIRIQFPNIEIARLGFRLLFRSRSDVLALGMFTFGLSTKKQMELLRQNNVPFTLIDQGSGLK